MKLEYPMKTHADTGTTCKLHTKRPWTGNRTRRPLAVLPIETLTQQYYNGKYYLPVVCRRQKYTFWLCVTLKENVSKTDIKRQNLSHFSTDCKCVCELWCVNMGEMDRLTSSSDRRIWWYYIISAQVWAYHLLHEWNQLPWGHTALPVIFLICFSVSGSLIAFLCSGGHL